MSRDECQELKNIKYKTMLLSGNIADNSTKNTMGNMEDFLEKEKELNKNQPWSKLDKTLKILKLSEFVDEYVKKNKMTVKESKDMKQFLKDGLERKKLQRVKDVGYDKGIGIIRSIPALSYNKTTRKFTLRNLDKKISTLKSIAPKRSRSKKIKKSPKTMKIKEKE